ncbi:MAG TPA: chemotaxis protein CheW [Gemmatimonadaceae bacterium]|nr:chemotaxis protein CheW [Gemmatimonadaceae bacterium]
MLASLEETPTTTDETAPRLLIFGVGGRLCACELDAIREIVPYRQATRLPGAPPFVTGLINLRGTILTVMDMGLRLGASPIDPIKGSIVLAESGTRVIGLGVDELRDVQRVPKTQIEPAEGEIGSGLVSGVLQVGEDVAMLLDVRAIIKQIFGGNL